MTHYGVNKGVGRNPEFKGLKAQYLFVFVGGLLAIFIVFVILYMAGSGQWVSIGFGLMAASALVWATFHLNAKYGEHGLMKAQARMNHPRYIISRKRIAKLFTRVIKPREA